MVSRAPNDTSFWVSSDSFDTLSTEKQAGVTKLIEEAKTMESSIEWLSKEVSQLQDKGILKGFQEIFLKRIAFLEKEINNKSDEVQELIGKTAPKEIAQKVTEATPTIPKKAIPPPPPKKPMDTRGFVKIKEDYRTDILDIFSQIQTEKESEIRSEKAQHKTELSELIEQKKVLQKKDSSSPKLKEISAKIYQLEHAPKRSENYLEEINKTTPEERRLIARGLFLEAFSSLDRGRLNPKEWSNLKDAILKGAPATDQRPEAKALYDLYKEFIDSPQKFFSDKTTTTTKSEPIKQKNSVMQPQELETLKLYLSAKGLPEKSIHKLCDDETMASLEYRNLQQEMKTYLSQTETVPTNTILTDPVQLRNKFLEKRDSEAMASLIEFSGKGGVNETQEKAIVKKMKEEATVHLNAKGVKPKEVQAIVASPVRLLETMKEIAFLRLALFDRGASILTELSQKEIQQIKNDVREELATYLAKDRETTADKVAPELEHIDRLLIAYKHRREDVSDLPSPRTREKRVPFSIREATLEKAFKQLEKGSLEDSLQIFLDESGLPSTDLLERMASRLTKLASKDSKACEAFLAPLSLFQSLWLLEKSSSQEIDQLITTKITADFFKNIETDDISQRQKAVKLFSYLHKYASDTTATGQKYQELLEAIEKDPRFTSIRNFL